MPNTSSSQQGSKSRIKNGTSSEIKSVLLCVRSDEDKKLIDDLELPVMVSTSANTIKKILSVQKDYEIKNAAAFIVYDDDDDESLKRAKDQYKIIYDDARYDDSRFVTFKGLRFWLSDNFPHLYQVLEQSETPTKQPEGDSLPSRVTVKMDGEQVEDKELFWAEADAYDYCESVLKDQYVYDEKNWYSFNQGSGLWEVINTKKVNTIIQKLMRDLWKGKYNEIKKLRKYAVSSNIRQYIEGCESVSVKFTDFDKDTRYLGTPEGVLDLDTGILLSVQESASKLITKSMACAPAPEGSIPKIWMKCLETWTGGDKAMMTYLQKIAGYALAGNPNLEQSLFFLTGAAKSGKSTFVLTLLSLFKDDPNGYGYFDQSSMFVSGHLKPPPSPFVLAYLKGKRLIVSNEFDKGSKWRTSFINKFSERTPVRGEHKFGSEFSYYNTAVLIFSSNNEPYSSDSSGAFARRFKGVPFNAQITKDLFDEKLDSKLLKELPEIFRWALDGLKLYRSERLEPPEIVTKKTAKVLEDNSWIHKFVHKCIVFGTDDKVSMKELRTRAVFYWYKENNPDDESPTDIKAEAAWNNFKGKMSAIKLGREINSEINARLRSCYIDGVQRIEGGIDNGWRGFSLS